MINNIYKIQINFLELQRPCTCMDFFRQFMSAVADAKEVFNAQAVCSKAITAGLMEESDVKMFQDTFGFTSEVCSDMLSKKLASVEDFVDKLGLKSCVDDDGTKRVLGEGVVETDVRVFVEEGRCLLYIQ